MGQQSLMKIRANSYLSLIKLPHNMNSKSKQWVVKIRMASSAKFTKALVNSIFFFNSTDFVNSTVLVKIIGNPGKYNQRWLL